MAFPCTMVITGEAKRAAKAKYLIESAFSSIGNREAQPSKKRRYVGRCLPPVESVTRISLSLGYNVMISKLTDMRLPLVYETKQSCYKYGTTTTKSTVSNCDRISVNSVLPTLVGSGRPNHHSACFYHHSRQIYHH